MIQLLMNHMKNPSFGFSKILFLTFYGKIEKSKNQNISCIINPDDQKWHYKTSSTTCTQDAKYGSCIKRVFKFGTDFSIFLGFLAVLKIFVNSDK